MHKNSLVIHVHRVYGTPYVFCCCNATKLNIFYSVFFYDTERQHTLSVWLRSDGGGDGELTLKRVEDVRCVLASRMGETEIELYARI